MPCMQHAAAHRNVVMIVKDESFTCHNRNRIGDD